MSKLADVFRIRPYHSADRVAVHRLAAGTAFFGRPVEVYLPDRRLFCDLAYRYYTDHEPEHGWVACANQAVVGFLMGCVDTMAERRVWQRRILPHLIGGLLRRRYRLGWQTGRYIFRWLRAARSQEFTHVDLKRYPAHLHLNIAADWRGQGLGQQLLTTYLTQLQALQVPGVHLNTTSYNEAACHLYVKMGFRLLDERPTQLWANLIDQPICHRSYGLTC